MPWVKFTADHIRDRVSDDEVDVCERIGSSDEGGSKIDRIVSQITSLVRGKCLANADIEFVGPDGTIPDFCVFHAATMGMNALLGLPPVAEGMTDPRREAQRDAVKFLDGLKDMAKAAFDAAPVSLATSSASYGGEPLLEF